MDKLIHDKILEMKTGDVLKLSLDNNYYLKVLKIPSGWIFYTYDNNTDEIIGQSYVAAYAELEAVLNVTGTPEITN